MRPLTDLAWPGRSIRILFVVVTDLVHREIKKYFLKRRMLSNSLDSAFYVQLGLYELFINFELSACNVLNINVRKSVVDDDIRLLQSQKL